jgi:hypothetical protein
MAKSYFCVLGLKDNHPVIKQKATSGFLLLCCGSNEVA